MRDAVKRSPVTIALVALLLAGAVLPHLHGAAGRWASAAGTGYTPVVVDGRWWTPITSLFFTDGALELVLVLAGVVVGIGAAERLMGPARTAVAVVLTSATGSLVGTGLQALGDLRGELWSRRVTEFVTFDPMTMVAGALMAASAFASPLWRRRIRVVVLLTALVFVFYSGEPSDLYRLIAALAGLLLGLAGRRPRGGVRWQRSSHHEARVLVSTAVLITGVGPLISVFSHVRLGALAPLGLLLAEGNADGVSTPSGACEAAEITRRCLDGITLERISGVGPVLLTLLPLLALVVAALLLWRGQRLGLWLAVTVNVALSALAAYFFGFLPRSGESYVVRFVPHGHYWEVGLSLLVSVLLPLAVAALLVVNARHFTIRAPEGRVRAYLASIGIALVALVGLYVGVGSVIHDRFTPRVDALDLLSDAPERFVPIGFLHLEKLSFLPTDALSSALYYWIGPTFWLVVIGGALVAALGGESPARLAGLPRVLDLLRAGGGGSLGYWATWPGNSYWFADDGRAAVAYRVINGFAITTSEPIGDDEAALAAMARFATHCDDNGWTPVFYSVHEPFAVRARAMGWSLMSVGEETVIRPLEWRTTGKRWQDIRTSINRAEREGVRSEWTSFARLSPAHTLQIAAMSEQWVAEKELPEMGFTLGGIDEMRDPDVRIMMACDADDHVVGLTSWLPSYRDGEVVGWTLDFMRRAPDGPNGIMEFLIARAAERFRDDGIETMSLSAAPLATADGAADDGAAARILQYIGARLEPVYGFRSLFQFKRKFKPELHTLYMAYPDPLQLAGVAVAIARAYVPSMSVAESVRFVRSLG